jgi:predicted nucleotidyltransferase
VGSRASEILDTGVTTVYSDIMSNGRGAPSGAVVDWEAGERRRRNLEAELERIVHALMTLGVRRVLLFGSFARGDVRGRSDLDLIVIADTGEPFVERCARFYTALAPRIGMDLLVYTPSEFEMMKDRPFVRHALRHAKVVYEA